MTIIVGQEKPSLEVVLAHHGVKGMRWGVRKDRGPGASTESAAARKAAAASAARYMVQANRGDPRLRTMTAERYANLSENGATFARGMELHRVTKVNSTQMYAGAMYVSKSKEDEAFYKAIIPATGLKTLPFIPGSFVSGGQKAYQSYDVTMKTTRKLMLPSDKERVNAFMEVLAQPLINVPGHNAPMTGRQFLEANGYKKQFKNKTDQEAVFSAYYQLLRTQGDRSSPINQAYFSNLQKKGFNAILDENDAGRYSQEPLIILDANKSVKATSIRRLTADEINQAQRDLRYVRPPSMAEKDRR